MAATTVASRLAAEATGASARSLCRNPLTDTVCGDRYAAHSLAPPETIVFGKERSSAVQPSGLRIGYAEARPRGLYCSERCRKREEMNPAHLDVVTRQENYRRWQEIKRQQQAA